MATGITNWVWKNSLSENAGRIVLLAIAHSADSDGKAEMSISELAAKCRLGERTVQVAVRDLVSLHELAVWPKAGVHGRNGYQVGVFRGADSAPLTPAGYAPKHRGVQNLHPAESAPQETLFPQVNTPRGADSAPIDIDPLSISTTGTSEVDVREVPADDGRSDVNRICSRLADLIEANGSKRPTVTANWRIAARLMLDRDGRSEEQVITAIEWCQNNEFWRVNILSMPKLREKYDRLRLDAMRDRASRNGRAKTSTTNDRVEQAREAGRRVGELLRGRNQ